MKTKQKPTKINKKSIFLSLLIVFTFHCNNLIAQTTLSIPDSNVSGSNMFAPLNNTPREYQMLIDDTKLTSLNGKYLTSITFRLPADQTSAWPPSDATFTAYEIYLSNSVDPVDKQLDFTANVVGTQTLVKSGTLVIPKDSFPAGSDPNPYGHEITFDTPWLYTGTNLLIEIRHSGNNSDNMAPQAIANGDSASGYGSDFSACWKNLALNLVINANFTYVKINAVNSLGVEESLELGDNLAVYPNPVKDEFIISTQKDINDVFVYNMAGQIVYSKENIENDTKFDLSHLSNGTYLVDVIDQDGNKTSKKIIKE